MGEGADAIEGPKANTKTLCRRGFISAAKEYQAGEELTFDYGTSFRGCGLQVALRVAVYTHPPEDRIAIPSDPNYGCVQVFSMTPCSPTTDSPHRTAVGSRGKRRADLNKPSDLNKLPDLHKREEAPGPQVVRGQRTVWCPRPWRIARS